MSLYVVASDNSTILTIKVKFILFVALLCDFGAYIALTFNQLMFEIEASVFLVLKTLPIDFARFEQRSFMFHHDENSQYLCDCESLLNLMSDFIFYQTLASQVGLLKRVKFCDDGKITLFNILTVNMCSGRI